MAILILEFLYRLIRGLPAGLKPQARKFYCILLILGSAFALPLASQAQPINREYQLKSVFLLNFAQFTTWPTNTFPQTNSPLVIGILGADPFGSQLDETVRFENWNGHPFIVQRYPRLEDVKPCHLLFVSGSETRRLDKVVSSVKGKPVLTVADGDAVASREIMIRLITQNNRIRFKINLDLVREANLTISSKLLRVAEVETTGNQ